MTDEEKLAEEYRKELKERLLRNDDYERLEMFDENVEEAYLAGRKSNSEVIAELEKEVRRLTNENKILTNENKILKQGKTNVFAELNEETAKSNEMLMDKVADLEAQIEKMKCCENCKYNSYWGCSYKLRQSIKGDELVECKNMDKWEIKENDRLQ